MHNKEHDVCPGMGRKKLDELDKALDELLATGKLCQCSESSILLGRSPHRVRQLREALRAKQLLSDLGWPRRNSGRSGPSPDPQLRTLEPRGFKDVFELGIRGRAAVNDKRSDFHQCDKRVLQRVPSELRTFE